MERAADRSLRLPALDLRAGDLRRLLRRLVGDAGAAHAADGVTNAISSVIVVGALLAVGVGTLAAGCEHRRTVFGFVALVLACVNIFGGFLVTQRMLAMYKKKGK